MKARWKAFASIAAAAALVIAPLATVGASAAPGDEPAKVFVCKYVGTPGDTERLQGGNNPISVSVNAIPGEVELLSYFEDSHGRSFVLAWDTGQEEPDVSECPDGDVPQGSVTASAAVNCDSEGNVGITVVSARETEQQIAIEFDTDGDGVADETYSPTVAPNQTTELAYTFGEDSTVGVLVTWGESILLDTVLVVDCEGPGLTPVPALFDIEPTPASCSAPGSLNTAVFPIDREGYTLTVDRPFSGPGDYVITATAKPGFVIQGSVSRTVTVAAQLSGPGVCPLAVIPQPEAPEFFDDCGTETDGFSVPDDTDTYYYQVFDNEEAAVTITAVLFDPENDEFADDATIEWSYQFTDVPCPTTTPGTPTTSTPTTPALAVTGGASPLALGFGAAGLLMAGIALLVTRRLVRS